MEILKAVGRALLRRTLWLLKFLVRLLIKLIALLFDGARWTWRSAMKPFSRYIPWIAGVALLVGVLFGVWWVVDHWLISLIAQRAVKMWMVPPGARWVIAGLGLLVAGGLFLQGLVRIPADPPHKGVLTILGMRVDITLSEGWHFLPLYPWLFGFVRVDMRKKNFDMAPSDVRTAEDMAEILVNVSVTFSPDPSHLIEYLNSGGEAGVREIIDDVVEEAVREFAIDPGRKPYTWEDAVKMKREFLAEVVATIMGVDPRDPDGQRVVGKITPELRRGNGALQIETLGIKLNRVNVTRIQPEKRLAEAAQKEAIEKREQKAETVEIKHANARIDELMMSRPDGTRFTPEQALEIFQTERGKVTKTVNETKLNVSNETRGLLRDLAETIVQAIRPTPGGKP